MARPLHLGVVAALGTAQTLAWASTYYVPAMLAVPMAKDLDVSTPTVFAAYSMALIVSALLGGRAERYGIAGVGVPGERRSLGRFGRNGRPPGG